MELVICEKPSVARSIANVIGANRRGDGFLQGDGYIVSWCYGHLVELAMADTYGDEYKRWSLAALPILPKVWQYNASKDKNKQISVLRKLMCSAEVESVICATDAGREGELIFRLVYNYCKCRKLVKRLWISSLTDTAIREGFAKLRPGADFDNLYRAALCRSQADWLVGINGTRLLTCLYKGPTLNVGRVQTPTLAMITQREEAIASFISKPFYSPEIDCGGFTAVGGRFEDFSLAEAMRSAAECADALVLSVEKTDKTQASPKLYDLTSLQRDANRLFGFTAQQTLDCTQKLYEAKLVTYPRTDSRYLTGDMKDTALAVIAALPGIFPFACALSFVPDISLVIDDSKVSDHHGIIPTTEAAKADIQALPSGERIVLSLITARLFCATAPAHRYESVKAVLVCGGNDYTAKGKTVLEDGWKAIETALLASLRTKADKENNDFDGENTALPELAKGQIFPSVSAIIREGKTKPPARFTEGTLLRAMETAGADSMPDEADINFRGLGTPATRAGIIEKIIKSGFVERQKKSLVPTALGTNLIAVAPDDVKSPALTSDWEQMLHLVEKGELPAGEFMSGIEAFVSDLVAANKAPETKGVSLFASMQTPGYKGAKSGTKGKSVGSCPRCKSPVTESTKGFFCSSPECKFALWKDSRFWSAKGKTLTAKTAALLLKDGRISFNDLKSEKTGKTYAATISLSDNGTKTDYKMEFAKAG